MPTSAASFCRTAASLPAMLHGLRRLSGCRQAVISSAEHWWRPYLVAKQGGCAGLSRFTATALHGRTPNASLTNGHAPECRAGLRNAYEMQRTIGYFAARVASMNCGNYRWCAPVHAMRYSTGLQIGQPYCVFASRQPPAVAGVKER
jgi:hypothetical protein